MIIRVKMLRPVSTYLFFSTSLCSLVHHLAFVHRVSRPANPQPSSQKCDLFQSRGRVRFCALWDSDFEFARIWWIDGYFCAREIPDRELDDLLHIQTLFFEIIIIRLFSWGFLPPEVSKRSPRSNSSPCDEPRLPYCQTYPQNQNRQTPPWPPYISRKSAVPNVSYFCRFLCRQGLDMPRWFPWIFFWFLSPWCRSGCHCIASFL